MDWKEEPATHQQLLRLQEHGFVPSCPLTVTQAARLIRQFSKQPPRTPGVGASTAESASGSAGQAFELATRREAVSLVPSAAPAPPALHPARPPAAAPLPSPQRLTESARAKVCELRLAVAAAAQRVEESPSLTGVRADLHSAIQARQQFWLDTCREPRDMQAASNGAFDFYTVYGARFFPPTWEDVGEVLEALDSGMPGWDMDHPELFYETLKLNFPSLVRHHR